MNVCLVNNVSTVATEALVLKHQAISIHSDEYTFIILDQCQTEISHLHGTISENEVKFKTNKKMDRRTETIPKSPFFPSERVGDQNSCLSC